MYVGADVIEASVDLAIIELKSKAEIFGDEAGFSDEPGVDDEISAEIQELTAKGSHEVSTFVFVHVHQFFVYTHTHTHTHTYIHTCTHTVILYYFARILLIKKF